VLVGRRQDRGYHDQNFDTLAGCRLSVGRRTLGAL